METSGLSIRSAPGVDIIELKKWAESKRLQGVLFQTSGSTGKAKWVHLSHEAMQASADAVNTFLDAKNSDVFLRALPDYHVGGAMIDLRAARVGAGLKVMEGKWNAQRFMQSLEGVTVTSLVPAQLVDLVNGRCEAPETLRVVLVGGGEVNEEIYQKSRKLSWPVLRTYGMTEACSQIATECEGDDGWLSVLPGWDLRTDELGRLSIKGPALFSGYVKQEGSVYKYEPVVDWFQTSDRVQLMDDRMKYLGRIDRVVKILGELVDLEALEKRLFPIGEMMVLDLPDERAGKRLLALGDDEGLLRSYLQKWNDSAPGYMRIKSYTVIDDFPRSALGKVDRQALMGLIQHCEEIGM